MVEIRVDSNDIINEKLKLERLSSQGLNKLKNKILEYSGIRISSIAKDRYFGKDKWPSHQHLWNQTGRLRASIGSRTSDGIFEQEGNNLYVGTRVVYGAIHEYGGLAGRHHSARIPARPYLHPAVEDFKNEELKHLIDIVVEELRNEIG